MPDVTFATRDEIPEGLREHAKEADGGKFVVNLVPNVKLQEFRDTNVRLSSERDELKAKAGLFESVLGDKPFDEFKAELAALRDINQQVKDGKLSAPADIEAEVTRRVGTMRSDFERQLAEQAEQARTAKAGESSAQATLREWRVDQHVTQAALDDKSGVITAALPDILARARGVFSVQQDGKLVAKDGEAIIYGADGATPMTPREWLAKLRESAPYYFKSSTGGGAGGGGGGSKGVPPGYTQETFSKLKGAAKLKLAREHGL